MSYINDTNSPATEDTEIAYDNKIVNNLKLSYEIQKTHTQHVTSGHNPASDWLAPESLHNTFKHPKEQ
jgi:hypothetical protein